MRALGIGRWASLTGVASVAAFVASALAVGFYEYLPAAVEIESFLESNSSRVAVGGYLGLYGSLLLLVWVSLGLRTSMGGAEGGDRRITVVAYAGGVTAVMIAMVAYAALIAAAARAGDDGGITETGAAALYDLASTLQGVAFPFALALLIGAYGAAALRTGVAPRWLAWTSLILALGSLTPLSYAVLGLDMLWVAYVSLRLSSAGGR